MLRRVLAVLLINSSNRSKKIPLCPPFAKGEKRFPLLWKMRVGEDFSEPVSSIEYPVSGRDLLLAMKCRCAAGARVAVKK